MEKDDLKNVVINCRTKEEARDVCNLADELGWAWRDGIRYTDVDYWGVYKDETCFDFYKGVYGAMDYSGKGYIIQSAQWFLDNFALGGSIKIMAGRVYRCLNDISIIDERSTFDFVRGDVYESIADGYLLNDGCAVNVCGVKLRDFEEVSMDGFSDSGNEINEIDWERRRWDLAKGLFISYDSKSADRVIDLADEFISRYRERLRYRVRD